jgi:hypothetical protein
VLYVALERRNLVERRAIAFRAATELADLPFAIVGGPVDFRDPRSAVRIAELARQVEDDTGEAVALIVIDTLSRALCGGDENSSKDMGAIVHATSVLQQRTSAHVMWVHHMPHDAGERMRGHGALLGAVDTTVHVARSGDLRTATIVKANDSEEGQSVAFTLESVVIGDDGSDVTTAPVVVPSETQPPRSAVKAKPLPKAAQIALRALAEAIDVNGSPPPASPYVPPGAKVVHVDCWRQQAYTRGISSGEPDARRKAFQRASEQLIAAQRVGCWDGNVWLATCGT